MRIRLLLTLSFLVTPHSSISMCISPTYTFFSFLHCLKFCSITNYSKRRRMRSKEKEKKEKKKRKKATYSETHSRSKFLTVVFLFYSLGKWTHLFFSFFQLMFMFRKIEWQIYIKDMGLWSSGVKKMLTMYVFPSPFSCRICSVYLWLLS